jgi:predicted nuclease with TOPRIM domain
LLRWAPGGETFEESVERLRDLLQEFDVRGRESEGSQVGEKLDRIEAEVKTLSAENLPRLENEIQELRKMLSDAGQRRDMRP